MSLNQTQEHTKYTQIQALLATWGPPSILQGFILQESSKMSREQSTWM